jgi:hypothetical protein
MSFFAILRNDASARFEVQKLDINLWVLPGIFGRQVHLCDLGLRIKILEDINPDHVVEFDLALPFVADSNSLTDLVPIIRDHEDLFGLIFGSSGGRRPFTRYGAWFFNDGEGDMRFTPLEAERCAARMASKDRDFSIWRITGRRQSCLAETSLYLRFRFRIDRPGRAWAWQTSERRHSHAVSDIRVNELRERPDLAGDAPDFGNDAMNIACVNCFIIIPARFKAGRTNPMPSYVRILESHAWQVYLRRNLGLGNEAFIITYWTLSNVTPRRPFRAFIEVERRRPTAVRPAVASTLITIAVLFLLQSTTSLDASFLSVGAYWAWAIISGLGIGALLAAWRLTMPLITNGRWKKAAVLLRRFEDFRYRAR